MMKVAIVGAGPAGCAAAITLVQQGVETVLLEREVFPRHRPGESLHPGIEPLLRQLGVWNRVEAGGYLRHAGIWVEWGKPRRFVEFGADADGSWFGLQVLRQHFDDFLLQTARESGAECVQDAARGIVTERGRVCGVVTDACEIEADYVLDATGTARWLTRHLNLETQLHSIPLIARYGYATGQNEAQFPAIVADDVGWTYFAQLDASTFHWTRVTAAKDQEPALLPNLFSSMSKVRCRGADVQWRIARTTAGRNWFLLGDAACQLDPSSSHGVMRAIMCGIMAADMIVRGTSPIAYDQWLRRWFYADAVRMRKAYAAVGLFGFAR